MTYSLPGGTNTFVPSFHQGMSGAMMVEFSRNVASFKINQWAQIVPSNKTAGKFLRLSSPEQARIVTRQDFVWPIGQDRPTGDLRGFEFVDWTTTRYSESANLPYETVNVADWDVVRPHMSMQGARRMAQRTMEAMTELTTVGNYTSGLNYFATAGAGSGAWGTEGNIQKGIQAGQLAIAKNTIGVVKPGDVMALMNPTTAVTLSQSVEVKSYVKNQEQATQFMAGNGYQPNWGLPPTLWNCPIVVDDTVRVTTRKKTDDSYTAVWMIPDNAVIFVSRPGGFIGAEGAPSFATVQLFVYSPNDMAVELFDEPKHHRQVATITDQFGAKLVAPLSAYYIADISS